MRLWSLIEWDPDVDTEREANIARNQIEALFDHIAALSTPPPDVKGLVERLEIGAREIDAEGTVDQMGPSSDDLREAASALSSMARENEALRTPCDPPPGLPTIIPRDERERILAQEARAAVEAELSSLKREVVENLAGVNALVNDARTWPINPETRAAVDHLRERLASLHERLSKDGKES